jgi:hypothetical protein
MTISKAKVEVGVQVVQRWILARLRNRRFFSLGELIQEIRELIDQLNDRPMRGWGTTPRTLRAGRQAHSAGTAADTL